MASGKFITFEGGEGSGKSTQAKLLADRLRAKGIDVVLTREPGGSPFAEQIRELLLSGNLAPHPPLAEALLFYAARADHMATTIRPALAAGRWVICDRFSDSTRVYQGGAGGLGADVLAELERLVVGAGQPHLTLILDLAPALGLARAEARRTGPGDVACAEADPYERRDLAFHERLRAGYLAIAGAEPARCAVVDAAEAADAIAARVWSLVESRLLAGRP
ncbi:MAG: dTMP kinase [Hyphomicrobiaceae bacterium]|nr:MAG: dTMP kinase [Hyphomicrobiaceae bacterium]